MVRLMVEQEVMGMLKDMVMDRGMLEPPLMAKWDQPALVTQLVQGMRRVLGDMQELMVMDMVEDIMVMVMVTTMDIIIIMPT